MAMMDTLKQLLGGASSAIASLKKAEAGIRAGLAALDVEQTQHRSLAEPRPAVEANVDRLVGELRARWLAAHGQAVAGAASGRLGEGNAPEPARLHEVLFMGPVTLDLLAALVPRELAAGLRQIVAETRVESGPALAARLPRLREIEAERQALRQRHAELVDEAAAAGVTLAHLPEEKARRIQLAQRHREWAANVAVNREFYERHPEKRPVEPPRPEPSV
jgi:hypothetical protein